MLWRVRIACWVPQATNAHPQHVIRRDADESFARLTSRCLRTESKVSLERRVSSFAELQGFSCYRGWKGTYQATRAISTTSRRELSLSFLPPNRHSGSPRPKKFREQKSAGKFLALIFWDQDDILHTDYLPKGQTINAQHYSSLLVQLKDILKEKRNAAGR